MRYCGMRDGINLLVFRAVDKFKWELTLQTQWLLHLPTLLTFKSTTFYIICLVHVILRLNNNYPIQQHKDINNPITGLDRPCGSQEAPRFQDGRHMNVVRLPAQRTGRLYTPPPPEAKSTPGPWYGWKDYVKERLQWKHRESNPLSFGL